MFGEPTLCFGCSLTQNGQSKIVGENLSDRQEQVRNKCLFTRSDHMAGRYNRIRSHANDLKTKGQGQLAHKYMRDTENNSSFIFQNILYWTPGGG